MAETFQTRIPTLADADLEEYLRDWSRYDIEAVEAALVEWRKRGHAMSDEEMNAIRQKLRERDTREDRREPNRATKGLLNLGRIGRRKINEIAVMMLILGAGGAIAIYLTAGRTPADSPGYDPLDTKKYLRELEVYGGKANILAVEFRQWFSGLWHGRSLAFTVAVITVLLSFAFWFVATRQVSGDRES